MAGAAVSVCNGPADPGTNVLPCVGSQTTTYTDWTLSVACTNLTSVPNPPGPPMGPTRGAGCTNPGLTDSHGNATIFAANGFYWAQIAGYQVVPQTFPFNIGSGGGGGGLIPCGVINDVQLYGTPGILGCDTGILIGNPSTHTLYDNIIQGNQVVQVGDTTNSGKIDLCQSNGSSCTAHFQMSLNSLAGAGYGVDWPNAAPSASTNCLMAPNTTDSNGRYLMSWGSCGSGGGAVSLEYEYPLDFTNAPSPTTSNDLIRTLFPQQGSSVFMGPPPFTNPLSAFVQSAKCGASATQNLTCSLGSPVIPGDAIFVVADTICGFGCFENFTFSDSLSNSYTTLNQQTNPNFTQMQDAVVLNAIGGLTTFTVTLSAPGYGDNYSTNFIIVELRGISVVDAHAESTPTWASPGSATSLTPITTSNSVDVILSTAQSWTSGANNLIGGTGYVINSNLQLSTNSSSNLDGLGVEIGGVQSTGSYTPTIIGTQQPTGGSAGDSFTVALKFTGSLTSGPPYFRMPTLDDQVTQGWFPDPTGLSGDCLSNNGLLLSGVLSWVPCGSGGGDTITSPNSTLTVGGTTSATTLDVTGAAGKMLAGATPALTYTPILGVDGSSAGTLQLANGSSPFHTIIGTQASANWTFKFPATAGTNTNLLETDGSGNTSWVAAPVSGDSITSPNSTITLGGTSTATTVDLAGVAGKIMAGATPALTFTPQLGVDNTNAGTLALSNGAAIAHTILGSAATTTNTILGPAVVIPNGHLLSCSTTSTTCTLADGGTAASGTVTSIATTAPITGGTITTTGTIACATCVVASSPGAGIARFAGSTQTVTSAELSGAVTTSGSNATTLATSYRTRSCEIAWSGSGTSFALTSGDDAIANNSCYNTIGVTETITAVQCKSDNASNTTTVTPTFGAAGTGTSICSGALTCGSSNVYSSTCTVSNASLLNGNGIDPGMGGTLTGTNIHIVVTYTLP